MSAEDVTREDIAAYALGDISEPEELERIEAAIETDEQAAEWYEEIHRRLNPSAAAGARIGQAFSALDRSVWARIQWSDATADTGSRPATIELPDGRQLEITVNDVEGRVELQGLTALPGWRPASLVVFAAARRAGAPLQSSTTAHEKRVGKIAAHSAQKTSADPARRSDVVAWRSPPLSNLEGTEAWLENSLRGLALVVRVAAELAPLKRVAYRLSWRDGDTLKQESRQGTVELNLHDGERLTGREHVRLSLQTLLRADAWELEVQPLGAHDAARLTSRELRSIAGDYQTMPLSAETEGLLTAHLRSETQRGLWSDPRACQMIRFEPI